MKQFKALTFHFITSYKKVT